MKNIFTWPLNGATDFIDPNYIGSIGDETGMLWRVNQLRTGAYKPWLGTSPVNDDNGLTQRLSMYNNATFLEETSGNNTFYKFWENPIIEANVDIIAGDITSADTLDPITFTLPIHGFFNGERYTATNFNSTLESINDNTFYVKVISSTEVQLAVDAGLTQLLEYGIADQDTGITAVIADPVVFTKTGYTVDDDDHVQLTGFDGTLSQLEDELLYVQTIDANTFNLSWDFAGTELLAFQPISTNTIESMSLTGVDKDAQVKLIPASPAHVNRSKIVFDEISWVDRGQQYIDDSILFSHQTDEYAKYIIQNAFVYQWQGNTYSPTVETWGFQIGAISGNGQVALRNSELSTGSTFRVTQYFMNQNDHFTMVDTSTGATIGSKNPTGGTVTSDKVWFDLDYTGDTVVLGYDYSNKLSIYRKNPGTNNWDFSTDLTAVGSNFGQFVQMSNDGNVVSSKGNSGATHYLFRYSGSAWTTDSIASPAGITPTWVVGTQTQSMAPMLSKGGNHYVIYGIGGIRVYTYSGGSWDNGTVVTNDNTYKLMIDVTGTKIICISWPGTGSNEIREYSYNGAAWVETQNLPISSMLRDFFACNSNMASTTMVATAQLGGVSYSPYIYKNTDADQIINHLATAYSDLYIQETGTADLYNIFTDRKLSVPATVEQLPAGVTSLTSPFTVTCDIGDTIADATTGTITEWYGDAAGNIIPIIGTPQTVTQGKLTIAASEANRYRLANIVGWTWGNKTYQHRTGPSTYTNAAYVTDTVWYRGNTTSDTILSWIPTLTAVQDVDGYLTDVTFNIADPNNRTDQPTNFILTIDKLADTYTPSLTLVEQQDQFTSNDHWANYGFDETKEWPYHVTPATATINLNQPTTVNKSQNGIKYARTGAFTKWTLEVEYPPMTSSDFKIFHSTALLAQGQAMPFYFVLQDKNGGSLLWKEFYSPSGNGVTTPRAKTQVNAGDTLSLVEGYASLETNAFTNGEVFILNSNQNGALFTAANTVNANVFGEAKVRVAQPFRLTAPPGQLFYKNPYHAVVTMSADDFMYDVDVNGYYYVSVSFDLDGWKA